MASRAIFQIPLKNSRLKITHNTFQDCHVHLFPTTFLEIAVYTVRTYIPCGAKCLRAFNFADRRFFFWKIAKYWFFPLGINFCNFQKVNLVSLIFQNSFSLP